MTHEYIGTKIVTAWPADKDGAPGYGVKYSDGYQSWSPKDVFEAAYVDIGHVAHLPPHLQRVIGEKAELDDKLLKLRTFFGTERFAGLDVQEQLRLDQQADYMQLYSDVLDARLQVALPGYGSELVTGEASQAS